MALQNIRGRIVQFFKRGAENYKDFKSKTLALTFPGIGGAGAVGVGSKVVQGTKNIFQRLTGNPLGAGKVLPGAVNLGKRILGRTIAGVGAVEGFNLAYSGATGKPYEPALSPRRIKSILGIAISPLGGALGLAAGGGFAGVQGAIDTGKKIFTDFVPPQNFNFSIPELPQVAPIGGFGGFGGGALGGSFAPSVSINPSAEIGRPGMDLNALALMLGIPLAVLLGYLGIKKARKKKKKSKKRKRH